MPAGAWLGLVPVFIFWGPELQSLHLGIQGPWPSAPFLVIPWRSSRGPNPPLHPSCTWLMLPSVGLGQLLLYPLPGIILLSLHPYVPATKHLYVPSSNVPSSLKSFLMPPWGRYFFPIGSLLSISFWCIQYLCNAIDNYLSEALLRAFTNNWVILTTTSWSEDYHPPFTDRETEARRGWVTCLGSS